MEQRTPYRERFAVGVLVRVQPLQELQRFSIEWKLHHPLEKEQLLFADSLAKVREVSFYHGGDALYSLEGVPGIWHEVCLARASPEAM
jgi:hypothetical protein